MANICFSHAKTDQNVRVLSGYLTIVLLVYLPGDLLAHYYVRKEQDSLKVDDEINIADLVTGLDELRIPPGSVKVACRGYGEDSYLAVTISL